MATAYSSEMSVGTYNRLRIKCDYSGTSATVTVQFRRTSSYSTTWSDDGATLTFNGRTKSASYYYSGNVGTSWIDLVTVSGYTISTTGSSYSFDFSKQYGILECSGSIWVPGQNVAPTKPTVSKSDLTKNSVKVTWGTTNLGVPTGTVSLYYEIYGTSSPTTVDTVSTTGNHTNTISSLNSNRWYTTYSQATNSVGTSTSDELNFVTLPPDIQSVSLTGTTATTATFWIDTDYYTYVSDVYKEDMYTAIKAPGSSTYTNIKKNYGTFSYTITGLSPNTTYTYSFANKNNAGYSSDFNKTFTTRPDVLLYGSVNGQTKKIQKLYGSVNGQTKQITKIYGSVNGVTKRIF